MLTDASAEQSVYLACSSTDMRKSIDGLAALVQEVLQLNPLSTCLFVFCNRGSDKLKILELLRRRNNSSYSDEFVIPTFAAILLRLLICLRLHSSAQ